MSISNAVIDKRIWKGDNSEIFSCKSGFCALLNGTETHGLSAVRSLWKMEVPFKVTVFAWLLLMGKLNCHDILQKRRPFQMLSPSWCVMFKKSNECVDHLFVQCSFSLKLWAKVLSELNVVWMTPRSPIDLLAMGHGLCVNKNGRMSWKIASLAAYWAIWLERNN